MLSVIVGVLRFLVAALSASYFGSGSLGDWTGNPVTETTASSIKLVKDRDGVFLFGDSITTQDARALAEDLLAQGDSLAVNAQGGRPTGPTVDELERWKNTYGLPSRVIVASGSNDIFDPRPMASQVERAAQLVGPQTCLTWVNVHVSRWSQPGGVQVADQRNTGWVNAQIAAVATRYPNVNVVDWELFLASKPSRIDTYLRDGVHTSVPLGQDARNALILHNLPAKGACR